ncbi:ABC transporter substrate-binding protein [Actinocorallia aurantiaca]|uniref:ABC transporter substrate-binding protein n=1 Tax=Actinocorallia aurantiaca TaxID=46204 RepID=A0ABN3U9K0_9ACTN
MKVNKFGSLSAGILSLALFATGCAGERSGTDGSSEGNADNSTSDNAFGTLASPCGAGDAKGATAQGVTDSEIVIGYGDDRGFTKAPGLNKEMGDAVAAMIAWCNEQGGINGRKIKGNQYDAAYMQSVSVMQKACKQDFMLVGQGFALDDAAEQYRVGCDLPTVAGFTVGANASMGPNKFEAVPYPVDHYNAANLKMSLEKFPEMKDGLDTISSTSAAVEAGTQKIVDVLDGLGVDVKNCGVKLNAAGDASYVPFAEKFKKCGVKALWTSKSPDPASFSMLEALDRVGLDVPLVFESTWYSDYVKQWNTKGLGDNIHLNTVFQPFENADKVPAVKKYQELVAAKDGKPALLGMQATSAFLLWATAAQKCGSDLTRECVTTELSKVHEWDGGGLHAPTDPGANMPAKCSMMLKLTGSEFEQVLPAEAGKFQCADDNVVKIDKKLWGTKLNADRISTTFLKS